MIKYLALVCSFAMTIAIDAQQLASNQYQQLHWRCIGPHRGGRTVGACGVPTQPNVFYMGVNNGGIWKTNDYGRTWKPIFDDQPTGSIGDIAVSPNHPEIIYAGTGEGLQRPDLSVGNGIYRSDDEGLHWKHLGLDRVQQVGGLALDPKNPDRLFVAALGHPYGPNPERGIYRTLDGGQHWERVLYVDENTGAVQVTIDPDNTQVIYADLWAARLAPWENGIWYGSNSGLYKSVDGGNNWKKLETGLPTTEQGLGRIGFCIAPGNSNRLYATVDAGELGGIYRSDNAGESWYLVNNDSRLWGRGSDFAEVKVDPRDENIVYSANVVTWKSTDGGYHWSAFRGAPGGDDYHRIWINPLHPQIIMISGDQGAIISTNGGETFSSWYNQPTAQLYHVSADNDFPYNVYSGQQESGSVCISSRGNDGQITFREWHPVGAEEYGYVVADPKDPDIVYGGKISRHDKRTGQTQNISPEFVRSGNYRFIRTASVVFNPVDQKTLYYAGNVLFSTKDGGDHWKIISPDLSRAQWEVPACTGIYNGTSKEYDPGKMARRGVIYTVAPSSIDQHTIWCGTDDGLIHITHNSGKSWSNVTTSEITSWQKISLMDASHFDINTAYAAVNAIRTSDMKPYIYRTRDGGKSWTKIVTGLREDPINVVKEDPKCKGLLFAGSETQVYFSTDDGEHWQTLRRNMPATSIRDLCIKDNDLVVATHGRSFWIMDNIQSLRDACKNQIQSPHHLFTTAPAYRVRWNMNTDTPLPQEEPAGENPPDGAMIDYYLGQPVKELELTIRDAAKNVIRRYSHRDTLVKIPQVNIPDYWIRPQQILQNSQGSHRFLWDLHHDPLNIAPSYPIAAIYRNTAADESSPLVPPGIYEVELIADGHTQSVKIAVLADPRVPKSTTNYALQYRLAINCYNNAKKCLEVLEKNALTKELQEKYRNFFNQFLGMMRTLQNSDTKPTAAMVRDVGNTSSEFEKFLGKLK